MDSSLRLFNLNDAEKPQGRADSGEHIPEIGKSAAASAANGHATGEAAMTQPNVLDAPAPLAQGDSSQETRERVTPAPHRLVGAANGKLEQELPAIAEVEGGEDEEAEEAAPPAGAELVELADFEAMFERFQTPIINFVYRLVGNREQAYDLAQDVFVKAYKALAGGTKIHAGALSAWLYRIAANTATDALRRRRLIAWLPLSLFNEERGVGSGVGGLGSESGGRDDGFPGAASFSDTGSYNGARFEQRVADREIVDKVLSKLPEKYSVCLLLYEHEGFSCNEIADVLKISPSAVKMRLMRARERFITLYKQEETGP